MSTSDSMPLVWRPRLTNRAGVRKDVEKPFPKVGASASTLELAPGRQRGCSERILKWVARLSRSNTLRLVGACHGVAKVRMRGR